MIDDRVDVYYMLDRLDEVITGHNDKMMTSLVDLRDELVYNLGVNQRIKHGVKEDTKNV